MIEHHPLVETIVACIATAFIGGFLAKRFKLPTIVGYLLAGVAVGPYTPGFVADLSIARQFAEIGVILLMFGVGLHFSLKDLYAVRKVALPGALFQIASAVLISATIMTMFGMTIVEGAVFGLCLSTASTVVLIRALEQRKELESEAGKTAIGWLIVEDVAMVLTIVLLPTLAAIGTQETGLNLRFIGSEIFNMLLKIGGFALLMIFAGRRILPWLLVYVAKTKSRELTSLAILCIALSFAYIAYSLFDASFALGAFLAGLVLKESEIGHKAVEQTVPLRDIFAVLFFVSVGMLFNPQILIERPLAVLATLFIIIIGKSLAAMVIMRLFRQDAHSTATISISLAQIGEFSFILGALAVSLGMMSDQTFNLLLAGALLSIAANHFLFKSFDLLKQKMS